MNAKTFVETYGQSAIEMTILTEAIGSYPGGPAMVRELQPDPAAPEIVMQVANNNFEDGEIGIFDYEDVEIL